MADTVHVTPAPKSGHPTPPNEPQPSLLSNVLAIVGFIILIVIIIWGLIHIAVLSQPWFSSLFSGSTSTNTSIVVTAPAEASSSVPMVVSWKYSPSEAGSYAFLYQCNDNLKFDTPTPSGTYTIPCGAAVKLTGGNNALSLTPRLSGTASISENLTILFMPNASSSTQAEGSAIVRITPAAGSATPTPTKTTTTKTSTNTAHTKTYRVSGPADLSVRIMSVGVDSWGNGTVVFDIANIGGASSGVYYFTANLPTPMGYFYSSPPQNSLNPGDHVVSTLRFTQATAGLVTIVADPSNMVRDYNRGNNSASQWVSGGQYGNYNNNQYNYQPQPYVY